jgi:hypothetical protein
MPRKLSVLFLVSLAIGVLALRADDTNMVLRLFPVSPGWLHSPDPGFAPKDPDAPRADIQTFFRQCGVTFPEGATLTYNPRTSQLHHYNTEENQRRIGHLLQSCGLPIQVQFDALFVDFPLQAIEQLARAGSTPAPRTQDILDLWRSGQGTLLHTFKLITRSGVNAQIQGVSEHIYATDFPPPAASNVSHQLILPVPGAFETRESGATLNITPTVGPDNRTIDVVMAPEITAAPVWQTLSVTGLDSQGQEIRLSIPQPLFHSRNITTCIVMEDGDTAVLGGMENPAGAGVTYLFLTATLLAPNGQPLTDYAGSTAP